MRMNIHLFVAREYLFAKMPELDLIIARSRVNRLQERRGMNDESRIAIETRLRAAVQPLAKRQRLVIHDRSAVF